MSGLKFYQVTEQYVEYLSPYAPHLFYDRREGGRKARKYVGVVLRSGGADYFAPLSSYKEKYRNMKERLDFVKVKEYAVINLNNMFPVPADQYTYVDISGEEDEKYRDLLRAEYRYIKTIQDRIVKKAVALYRLRTGNADSPVSRRCNDFRRLEELCRAYRPEAALQSAGLPPVHGEGHEGGDELRDPEGVPHACRPEQPAQEEGRGQDDHNVPAQGDDERGEALPDPFQRAGGSDGDR